MYLKYGTYQHPSSEVSLRIVTSSLWTNGFRYGYTRRWDVDGFLQAATPTALTAAIVALENAYSFDGNDAAFYNDDGSLSAHVLLSSTSFTGVKIVGGVTYPEGTGAEYSTFRKYAITLEASYFSQALNHLMEFSETLEFRGGGKRNVWVPCLIGEPQGQTTIQQLPGEAIQSGRAVGRSSYPSAPAPIWPQFFLPEESSLRTIGPQRTGPVLGFPGFINFGIEWSYKFKGPEAFTGLPNVWPY